MKTNSKQQDYHKHTWKLSDLMLALFHTIAVMGVLAYFFYRSIWAMLPLILFGILYFRRIEKSKVRKRRERLLEQFRECILSVSILLQAGYSLENAFIQCVDDMEIMYGADSDIYRELSWVRRGLHINISIEDLLMDFGARSDCEDIEQFAHIITVAKHSGGDLTEIIGNAARLIGRKIDLQQEIQTVLGGRQMELNVMKIIPFGILAYISLGNPGYFDALYHNFSGVSIMTGCLIVYLVAVWMGEFIIKKIGEGLVSS